MAFRDQNGKIIIDEVAAGLDIKNLNAVKERLQLALENINQIEHQASEFSGNTGAVIVQTAQQLRIQIKEMMNEVDQTSANIQNVVNKYQIIDSNLKNTFNGFGK